MSHEEEYTNIASLDDCRKLQRFEWF